MQGHLIQVFSGGTGGSETLAREAEQNFALKIQYSLRHSKLFQAVFESVHRIQLHLQLCLKCSLQSLLKVP